jgi:hypothetical protein
MHFHPDSRELNIYKAYWKNKADHKINAKIFWRELQRLRIFSREEWGEGVLI